MPPSPTTRLMTVLFPFWGLFWLTLALTGSGLWLHDRERYTGLDWGGVEMAHVAVGLLAAVVLLGYLVHHLIRHWGTLSDGVRLLGVVLAADLVTVTGTGLWLEIPTTTPLPGWVIPAHFVATLPILPLLILHTAQYVRRWMASRR